MSEKYDIYKNYTTGAICYLQKIRQERGLSREMISIATGVSMTVIYNIEQNTDDYNPKILALAKIAKYLNLKISDIYDFDYDILSIPNDELVLPNIGES